MPPSTEAFTGSLNKRQPSTRALEPKWHNLLALAPKKSFLPQGTTEGINAIAQSWAMEHLQANDRIIITAFEHHSNLLPWQRVAKIKGAFLDIIPVDRHGNLDYDAFVSFLTPKTKLIAVPQVSHIFGTQINIEFIIKKGHEIGAKILVDAAQAAPQGLVNVSKMKPDFLVFSGHKMLGPTGIGVLYINKEIIEEVRPYQLGGGMIFEAHYDTATWRPAPHRFEAGTPPIAQAIGLAAAIDYLNEKVDFSALGALQTEFCLQVEDFLSQFSQVTLLKPSNRLLNRHCINFMIKNAHPHDIGAFLDIKGIAVRAGDHCAQPFMTFLGIPGTVRLSFYCYNDKNGSFSDALADRKIYFEY